MGNDEFTWSKKEKEVARRIFDKALEREINQIKDRIIKLLTKYKEPTDIWKIHDYLSEKREEISLKYDYRYSVLMRVFSILYEEGYISDDDMVGLSDEKIDQIKEMAGVRKNLFKKYR
jgi:hypothetical protein